MNWPKWNRNWIPRIVFWALFLGSLLQQVFINLMLNAIEAMKDSDGELTVKSHMQDGHVQFSVSEQGLPPQATV